MRALIVPGNGCSDVRSANWYAWLEQRLRADAGFSEVVLRDMPDPLHARRSIWLPFLLSLGAAADTVLIGHSSGAVATMRLLEEHRLGGAVLVAACHTDLGEPSEAAAGYYPPSGGEWQWAKIRENAGPQGGNVRVLHSDNDPFIPLQEAQHVADSLGVELHLAPGRSHFFEPYEGIVDAVAQVVTTARAQDAA